MNNQLMTTETTLKRTQFAQNIRREQRQRMKQQIRDKFIKQINTQYIGDQNNYNDAAFQPYRIQCKNKNYSRESIDSALAYLFSNNVAYSLTQQRNLKFLNQVTEKICNSAIVSPWQQETLAKIQKKLEQLIKYQILHSSKDERDNIILTKELSQLVVLNKCFDGLLVLMEKNKCYHRLWIAFSYIRNQQLKNYAFQSLQNFVKTNIKTLQPNQISTIANTLYYFMQDCPDKMLNIITMIDTLFAFYNISPYDSSKFLDILLEIVTQPLLQQKVELLLSSTNLVENITEKLDKSTYQNQKYSFDLTTKVANFVARLFAVDNEKVCEQIYMKNIMILAHIRSWLPISPNVSVAMLQHFGSGSLTHNSHKCTKFLIFALTNIVVSHRSFLQTILIKSDIYRSLIIMYKLVPVSCRQQISIFLYNIVAKSEVGTLRIILETKLPQMIAEMLKQTNSIILLKTLGIIVYTCRSLEEGNQGQNNQWVYTRKRFKVNLQNLGVLKSIDSLVTSPQQKIAQKAIQVLQILN